MKITHFLQGIKEDTAMNFAISSKAEQNVNTFEEFYNSFSAKLSTKLTLTKQSQSNNSQCNISQINIDNRRCGNQSGRCSGQKGQDLNSARGGGRHGGRGRGGRGGRNCHDPSRRSS